MTSPDPHKSAEPLTPKLALVATAKGKATAAATEAGEVSANGDVSAAVAQAAADAPENADPDPRAQLITAIDRLSLSQALLDVEIANARVLDLTSRLVESNQRADGLRAEVEALRTTSERVQVQAEADVAAVQAQMTAQLAYLDEQRSSTAFRWAAKVWNLRNALRG